MTDIFHSWKRNRFVIAAPELVDDGVILVVLSDYRFWADHMDELTAWCCIRDAQQQGMTVVFKDETTLTEFILRWS